jgi:two-component system OmpR family response regulator
MTTLRVLHVDDEPDIREVVEISLGLDADIETRSCESGKEALALAAAWPADIILLDVMMPMMDGPATLARLRSNAQTASIPVVFMTARAQTRELDIFRSLGAVGVICKPFDPMTLAASVRSYVSIKDDACVKDEAALKNDQLIALQDMFLKRLEDDAATLARLWNARHDDLGGKDTANRIKDISHGLAGAGGVFGHAVISKAAEKLFLTVGVAPDISDASGSIEAALNHLLSQAKKILAVPTGQSYTTLDA